MGKFKASVFYKEVKEELSKVNWPTREHTLQTTFIVLVVVSIITVYLGLVDAGFSRLATLVMG